MRIYTPTPTGEQLAIETGVEALAQRLYDEEYDHPLIALSLLAQDKYDDYLDETDLEIVHATIPAARAKLKTNDELALFERAFSLGETSPSWRSADDGKQDGLFPGTHLVPIAEPDEADRFILSGLVGLSLTNFRQRCPLLARSRYEAFGFKTFNEACAFVGGHVVGRFVEWQHDRERASDPSFSHVADGLRRTIRLSGSFHGDFRMVEYTSAASSVITPVNTIASFGPESAVGVGGYHSVETNIAEALIESEYIRRGAEGVSDLLDELDVVLKDMTDGTDTPSYNMGNFADYGQKRIIAPLSTLRLLMTHPDYLAQQKNGGVLERSRASPASSTVFEIATTEGGIMFRNHSISQSEITSIGLHRDHYASFYRALLHQTAQGLGRTSPTQVAELVPIARSLIEKGGLID